MKRRLRSDAHQYGRVTLTLHWLAALCIILALVAGWSAAHAGTREAALVSLRFHVPIAFFGALFTLARILWSLIFDPSPQPRPAPVWQIFLARCVHDGL